MTYLSTDPVCYGYHNDIPITYRDYYNNSGDYDYYYDGSNFYDLQSKLVTNKHINNFTFSRGWYSNKNHEKSYRCDHKHEDIYVILENRYDINTIICCSSCLKDIHLSGYLFLAEFRIYDNIFGYIHRKISSNINYNIDDLIRLRIKYRWRLLLSSIIGYSLITKKYGQDLCNLIFSY